VKLIIHAPNVHQGGGRALLVPLLEAAGKRLPTTALLDDRLDFPDEVLRLLSIIRITPTIPGRLAGEWRLRRLVQAKDTVLCFGNLPPLFKLKGKSIVFLQNRYLVERADLKGFPLKVKLRLIVERFWLHSLNAHATTVIVQTGSMQQAAMRTLQRSVDVVALLPDSAGNPRRETEQDAGRTTLYDFLYVAGGEPHKNHVNLLDAWKLLASEGLYPSLCLTVSETEYPELFRLIDRAKIEHKLNIHNVPIHSGADMQGLYNAAKALVYPSLLESFGLPLLEAKQAGLSIVAAELDYVRDLVDPDEAFDPRSPRSIARAIRRFLQIPETPLTILSSDAFVSRLLTV
jgi:glycosyltransferase involved in cell wall biosynthesis